MTRLGGKQRAAVVLGCAGLILAAGWYFRGRGDVAKEVPQGPDERVVALAFRVDGAAHQRPANLRPEDIEIQDGGTAATVLSVTRIAEGRVVRRVQAASDASSAADTTQQLPVPRAVVLLVDDAGCSPEASADIKARTVQMRKRLIREGDVVAIVSTGRSSVAVDLTPHHPAIDEAIERMAIRCDVPKPPANGASVPADAGIGAASVAASTAQSILERLAKWNDYRKLMIYISGRGTFGSASVASAGSDLVELRAWLDGRKPMPAGKIASDLSLARMVATVVATANLSNTAIYAVKAQEPAPAVAVRPPDLLDVAAEYTNGLVVSDEPSLVSASDKMARETDDYFIARYRTRNDSSGELRRREVRLRQAGPTVTHPSIYQLSPSM